MSEKELEEHIIKNLHYIAKSSGWPPIKSINRQYRIKLFPRYWRLDILIIHTDNSSTIIEVKRDPGRNYSAFDVIGQILTYKTVVQDYIPVTRAVIAMIGLDPILYQVVTNNRLPIDIMILNDDSLIYLPNISLIIQHEV